MKFRFIGKYTNGHTSVSSNGVTFVGREPSEAVGDAAIRLARHPEFEAVEEDEASRMVSEYVEEHQPKRRGRPKKAAQ